MIEEDAYLTSVGLPRVKSTSDDTAYSCVGCLKAGKPTRWQGQTYWPGDLKSLAMEVKKPKPQLSPKHKAMISMLHGAARHPKKSPVADSILHHLRQKSVKHGD